MSCKCNNDINKYTDISELTPIAWDDADYLLGFDECNNLQSVEKYVLPQEYVDKLDSIIIDGDGSEAFFNDGSYKPVYTEEEIDKLLKDVVEYDEFNNVNLRNDLNLIDSAAVVFGSTVILTKDTIGSDEILLNIESSGRPVINGTEQMAYLSDIEDSKLQEFIDNEYTPTIARIDAKNASQDTSITNLNTNLGNLTNRVTATETKNTEQDGRLTTLEARPLAPNPSTTSPLMDGVAAIGALSTYARGDHRHPTDTTRASQTDLTSEVTNRTNADTALQTQITALQGSALTVNNIKAGTNITLDKSGNNVTINATGGGGSGDVTNATVSTDGTFGVTKNASGVLVFTGIGDKASINTNATNITNLTTTVNNKVDKVTGKQLSTEDYTTAEKNKLTGIEAGAEVNVQSDWNQTVTTADDYIKNKPTIPKVQTIVNGSESNYIYSNGIVNTNKNVLSRSIITQTGGKLNYIYGSWNDPTNVTINIPTALQTADGVMSAADKTKLDGIATGATNTTVEDVLNSVSSTNALSANMGRTLEEQKANKYVVVGSSKSILNVQVGDNLRGQTISFSTICGSPVAQANFFQITASNGYTFMYNTNTGSGASFTVGTSTVFTRYAYIGGWLVTSYTFPNDVDIIVSNVTNGYSSSTTNWNILNCIKIGVKGLTVDVEDNYHLIEELETRTETLETNSLTVDNIIAGTNITLNKSGNNVTINASGGGDLSSYVRKDANPVVIGLNANSVGDRNVVIGWSAGTQSSATKNVVIGSASYSVGSENVAIGQGSQVSSGLRNVAIGEGSNVRDADVTIGYVFSVGDSSTSTSRVRRIINVSPGVNPNDAMTMSNIWYGTQSEYDAITTKLSNVQYNIVEG